jgi:ParB-like chromosome segregation protein Spo0J
LSIFEAMMRWVEDTIRELALEDIGEHYGRYRLHVPEDERAMARSLECYGQLSPLVVCLRQGHYELIDGFKRLAAARTISGISRVSIRMLLADESGAKAAIYGLNRACGKTRELEDAWIVHALVREDGLTQVEVAELLGRHKSWVCRRLALIERLGPEAKDELRVGLLCPTAARQIVRLPAGNQNETLDVIRREKLSNVELTAMVDLFLECSGRRQQELLLQHPREALAKKKGFIAIASNDPRLSPAGHEVFKRLGMLIELLARMEVWLSSRGQPALAPGDHAILKPRFERLARDASSMAALSNDIISEFQSL